ncbi:FmdE family protein [Caldilinea sp.]|uniref:FmdE family protein n=1 Tax=Caldilinea sp. TaxID=2293560 RepID=UPI002C24FE01|nr:TraR/DksA C4-type zinc finger protein [Anaerolineales bacterium]HQY92599.1 FmdE family protein [Caldilinea sp.]HRA64996.1 FmdE family protein [Caldilinea sp.]
MSAKTLAELLAASAALHHHLCPRQVLGVQMGRLAAELLALDLPQPDKRLLTIVETDGCFCDGVSAATNCWVGRRTLRVEDYGKAAATFVDTHSRAAIRIAPHPQARNLAAYYAPQAPNPWEAMLIGYQRMTFAELFTWQTVTLATPVEAIISKPGHRVNCARCGEEILNEREVVDGDVTLCRACALHPYYYTDEHSKYVCTEFSPRVVNSHLCA